MKNILIISAKTISITVTKNATAKVSVTSSIPNRFMPIGSGLILIFSMFSSFVYIHFGYTYLVSFYFIIVYKYTPIKIKNQHYFPKVLATPLALYSKYTMCNLNPCAH